MANLQQVVPASLFDLITGQGARHAPAAAEEQPRIATVEDAASVFKALGHEGRLLILCHLASGEKSVTELEGILDARQSAVSQQLARLRMQGLVNTRREGQMIYYSIKDRRILELLQAFATIFHSPIAAER